MKSKYSSSQAFTISFVLHLIFGAAAFFFWPAQQRSVEQIAIEGVLMPVEKPQTKRINPPKRARIQTPVRSAIQTNQPSLKILTSNAPPTERGIVSADKPMPFRALDSLDLGRGIGLTTSPVTPRGMPQIERVITTPVKPEPTEPERPKSRLVKFIERQEGLQRLIYCVDLSASMLNLPPRKLHKVLAIIEDSLGFLELHDQFNIMTFSGGMQFYRTEFLTVDDANVSDAVAHLEQAKPIKSGRSADKDMLEALQEVQKKQPTIIVLFSDGILTSGLPDLKAIQQQAAGNAKIFTMGTEMAEDFPGAVLLRKLAEGSDGEFWLVETER